MNIIKLRPSWDGEAIIESRIDVDFYKFPMGQFIVRRYPGPRVKFGLKLRNKGVDLTKIIPKQKLVEQLDHAMSLLVTNSEIHYLRGTDEYGARMFGEDYLTFLRTSRLCQYSLEYKDGEIILEFYDYWKDVTYWETLALSIINELRNRELLLKMSRVERDAVFATGVTRLMEKIKILKANPQIKFSEFGTRRRFTRAWQRYVVEILKEELPKEQFKGTSNTLLAMQLDLMPTGTNAHELPMVISAIMGKDGNDAGLIEAQQVLLREWWKMYGKGLSIFLPDTFGTESFLRHLDPEMAQNWIGPRLDSGDPIWEGDLWLGHYSKLGIDSRDKLLIPSDGLTLPEMIRIEEHFRDKIAVSFGWGSDVTNDLGIKALSLVIKPKEADGIETVKLSNNLAKAIGTETEVARYMRVHGYEQHERVECKY